MRANRRFAVLLLPVLAAGCVNDFYGPEPEGLALQFAVAGPPAVSQAEASALAQAFDIVDRYVVDVVDDPTGDPVISAEISIAPGALVHNLDITVPEEALGTTVRIALVAYSDGTEMYRSMTVTTLSATIGTTEVDLEIRYSGPGIRGVVVDDFGVGVAGATVNLYQSDVLLDGVETEPDGTYLLLDVPTGPYQVVVPVPAQYSAVCPPVREVTIQAPEDAVVVDFQATEGACGISALVVSGGDFDDTPAVEAILANDPDLTTDSWFFVSQPPGLDELRQHDVVFLFTNGLFNESVGLGDQIGEYVSEGGNVVVASFYWQVRSDAPLGAGWGALEALDPFTSTGGATYQAGDLVSIDSNHPLTEGVQTVTSTGFWGGVGAKPGTTVLAEWVGSVPFIGYRVMPGGQRIVGVSLFPASGSAATGDWEQVFLNAVRWAGSAGGPVPE